MGNSISPIIEKVTCPQCGTFFGFIRANNTGPIFDECPHGRRDCCMGKRLARYQPKVWKEVAGSAFHLEDQDAGGYRTIAVRALEDCQDEH